MKRTIFILMLALDPCLTAHAADTFAINGISTGQSVEEATRNLPSLQCATSCVADNVSFHGSPGRFWASLKEGKIDELAFRFKPAIDSKTASLITEDIEKKHGKPQSNLDLEGCNEWPIGGGFLAVCLTNEISHVMWSHSSRVDVNERAASK